MRFDYCKGKSAKYVVSVYYEIVEDHYYFHYYKEAKDFFERLKSNNTQGVTRTIKVSDLTKDITKDFYKSN